MRFSLSTFLLVVLSIAILIGWWVDQSQRVLEETIVTREVTAAHIYFSSATALEALDPAFCQTVEANETALVRAVIRLCRNEELYDDSSYSYSHDATTRAGSILEKLKLNSPIAFREFSTTLYPFMTDAKQISSCVVESQRAHAPNEKYFPELYDTKSVEYKRLDDFLSRSIRRGKTKVPGTENETDSVKTESKSPE